MRHGLLLVLMLGAMLGAGCAEEAERPGEAEVHEALFDLALDDGTYLGMTRTEFLSAMERRQAAVERVLEDLRARLDERPDTPPEIPRHLEGVDELHGELAEELFELRVDETGWKERRERILPIARRFEEKVTSAWRALEERR